MGSKESAGIDQWLYLACPSCQGQLRYRAAEAPRRFGPCPKCGGRIEATGQESTQPFVRERRKRPKSKAEDDGLAHTLEPPAWPLWQGVYSFPWHLTSLRVWILLTIGMVISVVLGTFVHYLADLIRTNPMGFMILTASAWVFIGFFVFSLWTWSYAAADFLGVIQDTSTGNDEVRWPEDGFLERLLQLGYVLWIGACSTLPCLILGLLVREVLPDGGLGWCLVALPMAFLFPLALLGSQANETPWLIVSGDILIALARRPVVLATLWAVSVVLLVPCVWLGYASLVEIDGIMAILTGVVWATCLLIYGRLLGRVAWIITGGDKPTRRRRKRKKTHSPDAVPSTDAP